MKRSIAITAALVGLVVLVPTAAASDTGDTTTAEPATTTSTEVPVTTTTTTSTSTPTTTTTTVPTTTTTTTVPTTGTEAPCLTDCIPVAEAACTAADCIPTSASGVNPTVGAGALPFTGIEDMVAPILLALTVVLGGVVAWRWARLRESVAEAAQRARPAFVGHETRSGYAAATRNFGIEQRARQVFTPRVA